MKHQFPEHVEIVVPVSLSHLSDENLAAHVRDAIARQKAIKSAASHMLAEMLAA